MRPDGTGLERRHPDRKTPWRLVKNMSLATNSATQTLQPASTLDQMAPPPEVLIGQLPPTDGTPLSTNKRKSLLVQ
jgi:hypothetical protein